MPDVDREVNLRGGCALGCVAASMAMALTWLGLVALLAFAVGIGQSWSAVSVAVDRAGQTQLEEPEGDHEAPPSERPRSQRGDGAAGRAERHDAPTPTDQAR